MDTFSNLLNLSHTILFNRDNPDEAECSDLPKTGKKKALEGVHSY